MEQEQSPQEGSCGDQTSPQASSVTSSVTPQASTVTPQDSTGTQTHGPQTPQERNPSDEAQAQPSPSNDAMNSQTRGQPVHSPAQSSQKSCPSPQLGREEPGERTPSGHQTPLSPPQGTPSTQSTPSGQGITIETNSRAPINQPSNPSVHPPALDIPAWRFQG